MSDPEKHPIPQQLNQNLKQIFELIPRVELISPESPDSFDDDKRRRDSHFSMVMEDRLDSLLKKAPITARFRQRIFNGLTTQFEIGIPKTKEEETAQKYFWFLDQENEQSGGIFDPTRAEILERRAIAERAAELAKRQQLFDRINLAPNLIKADGQSEISQWKQDFKETYGKEFDD